MTRYTFADVENSLDDIKKFQCVFGAYFPYLLDDEHQTIIEYSWLANSVYGNPTETVPKAAMDRELKKLRKAIQTIADHPKGYWHAMVTLVAEKDVIDRHAKEIFKFTLAVDEMAENGELPRVLARYDELARQAVGFTADRRNINWEAVHAVYRLRTFWWRNTDTDAPRRALNPTSTFASYLRDAFEFLDISGDPISAFKRWAALAAKDDSFL